MACRLVVFGTSNILSDLFDCALANGIEIAAIVSHLPERRGARDVSVADRIAALAPLGTHPAMSSMAAFRPAPGEVYLLGPTTPARAVLAGELRARFALTFTTLVHPRAYVSPLAQLGEGVFVGANSVVGPGATLEEHVFVNRGVTIGHDTRIGPFSRIQPGSNIGGLSRIGRGVTIGIGATLIERLVVGANAFVGAGSVVTRDVPDDVLVFGAPARVRKRLAPLA